jgi:hypothetical protein
METATPDEESNKKGITIMARLLAAAAAVVFCFLLYRFAQAFYYYRDRPNALFRRNLARRRRPYFSLRKDILYDPLSDGGQEYEDDVDAVNAGYRDDFLSLGSERERVRLSTTSTNSVDLDRPLPKLPEGEQKSKIGDKPLPPLPLGDFEED